MTSREIKAALVLAGVSQTEIARKLDLSPAAVGLIIAKRSTSARIFKAIADAIGKPVAEVFPESIAS